MLDVPGRALVRVPEKDAQARKGLTWYSARMLRFDAEAFRRLNNLAGKFPAVDAVGVFCARYLVILMFAAVVARTVLAARRPDSRDLAALLEAADLRAVVSGMLAFVGNWLFSLLVFRPRPFVVLHGVHRIVPVPISPHSFPSSHSSVAFALAFSMLFVDIPFGLVLLVCATAVAFGRVYVGVHYPLDVIVGIFVGLFWALAVQFVGVWMHDVEYFAARFNRPKGPKNA
jgi:undecaprenyl-diphosphatase